MFTLTVFEILQSEVRSVLSPTQQGTGSERVKLPVKNQKNIRNLFKVLEKWLIYKLRRFWMVCNFFWFCVTLSVPQKIKNSIFEMPIILQTLNISNLRTTSAKSINLHTIRKLIEYSLKKRAAKAMFTLISFEILLSEVRSLLSSAQRGTRGENC